LSFTVSFTTRFRLT